MTRTTTNIQRTLAYALVATSVVAASVSPLLAVPASAAEKAVAPEKNPPGDIPDSQVFVTYSAKSGYSLKVPEGWARSDLGNGVSFVDKLDGVLVKETADNAVPTLDTVKTAFIPDLEKRSRALKLGKVEQVQLPAGKAVRISFSSNSEPNAVTNKQVRLENEIYVYHKGGKTVSLQLYAPYGADNVDQWNLMSRSFRWK
ncbi:hypothetical protein NAC44_20235 [Allorhizobium sp. BGMRC 0089]|uniref:hypothetical protein n=1 Tax=Allorhizobium sonneratiae TaxID=2934936 RepID=UPI002034010F|nr:hypothetical protein [Allorhizobium sonneratiae]MCM2294661.1 hypothetical protein [Allorhizobium sonneratiae]